MSSYGSKFRSLLRSYKNPILISSHLSTFVMLQSFASLLDFFALGNCTTPPPKTNQQKATIGSYLCLEPNIMETRLFWLLRCKSHVS